MKTLDKVGWVLVVVTLVIFSFWNRQNPDSFFWVGFSVLILSISFTLIFTLTDKGIFKFLREGQAVGLLMNLVAISSNGGRMPVYAPWKHGEITGTWKVASSIDHFQWMCDRYTIGGSVFSIGDFFLIGFMLLMVFWPRKKVRNANKRRTSLIL